MLEHLLRGLLGVLILIAIASGLSANPNKIRWRLILAGLLLQLTLAVLVLKTPFSAVVGWVASAFVKILTFAGEGSALMFGDLVDPQRFGLAFGLLPIMIFVSAITSALYYLGILQRVVWCFAWVMKRAMGLSGAESLATAANIFVGQTEAPLVVKPYIASMSRSEIMALMTGGMATIAGTMFALYVTVLAGEDTGRQKEIGLMLLTASIMNAPAAMIIAKIMVPETEEVEREILLPREDYGSNLLDALARGTVEGLKLALNVAAILIVFVALIAMFNFGLNWVGNLGSINEWISVKSDGAFSGLSMEAIVGFLLAPLAWAIGGTSGDLLQLGQLFGVKIVTNEFLAYLQLATMADEGSLSGKSVFLATFALCGFANFGSVGIQIAGIGAICPEQRSTLAELGFRALIGGMLASLLTASIAGMFWAA